MSEVGCPAEKARKIQDLEDLGILFCGKRGAMLVA